MNSRWWNESNSKKVYKNTEEHENIKKVCNIITEIGAFVIIIAYISDIILTGEALDDDARNKDGIKRDENVVVQIKHLKELLNDNLITQEEFDYEIKELIDIIK